MKGALGKKCATERARVCKRESAHEDCERLQFNLTSIAVRLTLIKARICSVNI